MKKFNSLYNDIEKYKLCFEAIAVINSDYAYGASSTFNGLFLINLKNGKCEFITCFPDEAMNGERLFYSACYLEEKVFFAPQAAKHIHIFHVKTQKITKIEVPEEVYRVYNRNIKFCEAFVYDSKVIMVGACCPAVVVIDPLLEKIIYYPILIEDSFLFRKGVVRNSRYFVASSISNLFIEINLDTMEIKTHRLPINKKGTWNLCDDTKYLWFTPRYEGECFIRWNPDVDIMEEVELIVNETVAQTGFLYTYYMDGYLYTIPESADMSVCINVSTLEVKENCSIPRLMNEKMGLCFLYGEVLCLVKTPREKTFYEQKGVNFYYLNKYTREIREVTFLFFKGYEKFLSAYAKDLLYKKKCFKENRDYDLLTFLKLQMCYRDGEK